MRPNSTVLTSLPSDKPQPNTGGMTWLPDGRLFIAGMSGPWGGAQANISGPSSGYIFSGISGAASATNVTVSEVAATAGTNGYYLPSGAVALGDTIYVVDNANGLTKLTPNGSGGYTKSIVYKGLLGTIAGVPGDGNRRWDAGPVYKDGYFYVAVGMGLITNNGTTDMTAGDIVRGRGTILKISKDGSTVDTMAGGVRVPVALEWGPDGEMFLSDNQGSWRPASAIFHVKQGRFFGHMKTPFDNVALTPPAIIFPYGSSPASGTGADPVVARVATDMLTLTSGPYVNQMLVGAAHTTGMNRVFMEKIGGEYQGAVFPFSQGFGVGDPSPIAGVIPEFRTNVHRMTYGPDGAIYLGGGGAPGAATQGSWGFTGSQLYGLARLAANNTPVFEMKAVRSLSATQMQVEFTEPVNAVAASNFTVRQGGYLCGGSANDQTYGAGKLTENNALTVTAATLDSTKTKVTLTITGLKQRSQAGTPARAWGFVQQIQVFGVTAISGHAIWGDGNGGGVAWYTTNVFGPGVDVGNTVSLASHNRNGSLGLSVRWKGDVLAVQSPVDGSYSLRVLNARGSEVALFNGSGKGDFLLPGSALVRGLNVLEVKSADGRWTSMVAKP